MMVQPVFEVRPAAGKQMISVFDLLVWAFRDECAQLEFDEIAGTSGERPGVDTIYRLMESARLGCRVDGGGRSEPHPDADVVASAVAALPAAFGGRSMAVMIAEHARAARLPDCLIGVKPVYYPAAVVMNRHGERAKMADASDLANGWKPYQRRNKKGALVAERSSYCPCYVSPSIQEVQARRRDYLRWWSALLEIKTTFQGFNNLSCWIVSSKMPPRAPWRKKYLTKS